MTITKQTHLTIFLLFIVFFISALVTEKNVRGSTTHETSTEALVKEIQTKYKNTHALTAEFIQKQTNAALGSVKESSGRIYIKRPDMFRWETLSPDASILVGNGKKVWYYTPPFRDGEKGQVMVKHATDVQSRLAIDLLAGSANLKKDFKISKLSDSSLKLYPLRPAGDVEHIELFLERPTNLVYKLQLFTKTGNQTELTLKNVTLDPKLGKNIFIFTPPANTEEIR